MKKILHCSKTKKISCLMMWFWIKLSAWWFKITLFLNFLKILDSDWWIRHAFHAFQTLCWRFSSIEQDCSSLFDRWKRWQSLDQISESSQNQNSWKWKNNESDLEFKNSEFWFLAFTYQSYFMSITLMSIISSQTDNRITIFDYNQI